MASVKSIFTLLMLAAVCAARGADYQFSVPVGGSHSDARTFLWIPPKCAHVRGILLGQQVILEKRVCDDPFIRAACAKESLAILLCYETPLGYFDYSQGADKKLQQILDDLAAESGYSEIASVPLLPFGHSGNAIFAGTIGYWNPARTLGIITLHAATIMPPAFDHKATLDGIPLLAVTGENEMWASTNKPLDMHWRWLRGGLLDLRGQFTDALVSELVQPGATHFSWDEPLARHVAMFIEKVAAARLPKDVTSTNLNHLVQADGWLTDNALMTPSRFAPAPYREYKGHRSEALWFPNEKLARTQFELGVSEPRKKIEMFTLLDPAGNPISLAHGVMAPMPDPQLLLHDDGLLTLTTYRFTAPPVICTVKTKDHEKHPEEAHSYTNLLFPGKSTLPVSQLPVQFNAHSGVFDLMRAEQFKDERGVTETRLTLRLTRHRLATGAGFNMSFVRVFHEGNEEFSAAGRTCQISLSPPDAAILKSATNQTIHFPPLPDEPATSAKIELYANSSAGLPVD